MDRKTIFEMKEELQNRGYYVESFNEKYFVVSRLKDNDGKLYYVYANVYDNEGKLKVFDLNIRSI